MRTGSKTMMTVCKVNKLADSKNVLPKLTRKPMYKPIWSSTRKNDLDFTIDCRIIPKFLSVRLGSQTHYFFIPSPFTVNGGAYQ